MKNKNKTICPKKVWWFDMCCLNPFLDLETFPQRLQVWETPLMWLASICVFILAQQHFKCILDIWTSIWVSCCRMWPTAVSENSSCGKLSPIPPMDLPFYFSQSLGFIVSQHKNGWTTICYEFMRRVACTAKVVWQHYSFLMSWKSSCFAAAWYLAPCPHSQCLFRYVLLMQTKFSCLAAAWDLAPCPHFHYLPIFLLHHQAGDRKSKVSNFRWLRDRKIGSGILNRWRGGQGPFTSGQGREESKS